jgi:acyl carrier protein
MPLAEPGELEAWLSAWLAPRLGLAAADVDRLKPFHEYGLDSLVAVELSGRLEQLLGRPVSPSAAWEHPTINGLSEYLRSGQEPEFIDMDLQA